MSTKTKEILQQLDKGIQTLCESKEWKNYLSFLSKFPNYSYQNTLLIYLQKPNATLVQGLTAWNKMNGYVKKGSHAIRILAPHMVKKKDEKTGEEIERISFHAASVFDISDVIGVEIPDDPCRILNDSVCDYDHLINNLIRVAPCPVSFELIETGAKGIYNLAENRIIVKTGMPEAQTVKTLIHEIAHSFLHGKNGKEEKTPRETREIEAESVAYVVCRRLGIDSSDYSFAYIAGWANQNLDNLKNCLQIISSTADDICDRFDIILQKAS